MTHAENIVIKAILGLIFLLSAVLAASPTMADYVKIKGTVVNVRHGPGTTFPVLFQAKQDDEFDLLKTEGLWCLINLEKEEQAWVFGRLVEILPGERPSKTTGQPGPGEKDTQPSLWMRYLDKILIILLLFIAVIAFWKRRQILNFVPRKLREISGYSREQPFRYDNRNPKDDSWKL